MENYKISISMDELIHDFEIAEYLHQDGESCKIRVFQLGKFVASFRADSQYYLHICQNPAGIDEQLLHLLADELEARYPRRLNQELQQNE